MSSAIRLVWAIEKVPFRLLTIRPSKIELRSARNRVESPFDPVIKARLRHLQEQGENPFMSYQVPRAVITLRQGAGRLIRSQSDKGVLMICDSRLRTTHYGRVFLDSLPPMARTQHQDKILQSLSNLAQSSSDTASTASTQ